MIAGVILFFLADKLVDWMHGAEGRISRPVSVEDEVAVTGTHEVLPEHRPG
jgi:POT family proton-dependent oligopeptide transporter